MESNLFIQEDHVEGTSGHATSSRDASPPITKAEPRVTQELSSSPNPVPPEQSPHRPRDHQKCAVKSHPNGDLILLGGNQGMRTE